MLNKKRKSGDGSEILEAKKEDIEGDLPENGPIRRGCLANIVQTVGFYKRYGTDIVSD